MFIVAKLQKFIILQKNFLIKIQFTSLKHIHKSFKNMFIPLFLILYHFFSVYLQKEKKQKKQSYYE